MVENVNGMNLCHFKLNLTVMECQSLCLRYGPTEQHDMNNDCSCCYICVHLTLWCFNPLTGACLRAKTKYTGGGYGRGSPSHTLGKNIKI